jgi:hypothetical protein
MNSRIVVLATLAGLALTGVGCGASSTASTEKKTEAAAPACTYVGGVQQSFPAGCDSSKPETAQNKREEAEQVAKKAGQSGAEAKGAEAGLEQAKREGKAEAEHETEAQSEARSKKEVSEALKAEKEGK